MPLADPLDQLREALPDGWTMSRESLPPALGVFLDHVGKGLTVGRRNLPELVSTPQSSGGHGALNRLRRFLDDSEKNPCWSVWQHAPAPILEPYAR